MSLEEKGTHNLLECQLYYQSNRVNTIRRGSDAGL